MSKIGRFTDGEVRAIRKLIEPCSCCGQSLSYSKVAKRYGVTAVTVHHIVHRRSYAHVD